MRITAIIILFVFYEAIAGPSNGITRGVIESWKESNDDSEIGPGSNIVPTELRSIGRIKRDTALPSDARRISIHIMRLVNFYGSSDGAYKVHLITGTVTKIPGISGNVISATISDGNYLQNYNVYFTVKTNNGFEYYALKHGENVAQKINGLPNDAILMCIHNLANHIFFGTSDGAYELQQGTLNAKKVPHVSGKVVRIKAHGLGKYNVTFETIKITEDSHNKLKSDIERLQVELGQSSLQKKELEDQFSNILIQLEKLGNELSLALSKIKELEDENDKLRKEKQQLKNELVKVKQQAHAFVKQISLEHNEDILRILNAKKEELDSTSRNMQQLIEEKEKRILVLEDQVHLKNNEIKNLKNTEELTTLKRTVQQFNSLDNEVFINNVNKKIANLEKIIYNNEQKSN